MPGAEDDEQGADCDVGEYPPDAGVRPRRLRRMPGEVIAETGDRQGETGEKDADGDKSALVPLVFVGPVQACLLACGQTFSIATTASRTAARTSAVVRRSSGEAPAQTIASKRCMPSWNLSNRFRPSGVSTKSARRPSVE